MTGAGAGRSGRGTFLPSVPAAQHKDGGKDMEREALIAIIGSQLIFITAFAGTYAVYLFVFQ